jgi:AcrR family transcriptional regulator
MARQDAPTPPIWLLPEPPSRQRSLDRAEIVRAAVELADAGGSEALNMRALATRLGSSTPMSLYRYVHNKDGLVDLMLDAAEGEVPTPEQPSGDWRADVTGVTTSMWAMANRHPWFAELTHSRPATGPHCCRRREFLLTVFVRTAGQDLTTAMNYLGLLDGHVIGLALAQAEERKMWRRNNFTDVAQVVELTRSWLGPVTEKPLYPLLERVARSMTELDPADVSDHAGSGPDVRFELGLNCLLDGIAARVDTRPV